MPHFPLQTAPLALGVLSRIAPPLPLRAFLRVTEYRLRPPQPAPHVPAVTRSRDGVLARCEAGQRHLATVLRERRGGDRPTIVLGGFVPDSTEQVFLLRSLLLRYGSVYYLNYPRGGFSVPMICAQLDDLVEELRMEGRRPVILSVSFGSGILIEWLRRWKASRRSAPISGAVMISPVACHEDVVDPSAPKPTTLLGRALGPFGSPGAFADPSAIERARSIFLRMFEAGANNRAALAVLMSPAELRHMRDAVASAISGIDPAGACERVGALGELAHPREWAACGLPLSAAPALILYAEKEDSVIAANSPTRKAFESGRLALFPRSECRIVAGGDSKVQHASLILHYYQFLPHIAAFFRGSKPGKFALAA
jgi:hypothetical protein